MRACPSRVYHHRYLGDEQLEVHLGLLRSRVGCIAATYGVKQQLAVTKVPA